MAYSDIENRGHERTPILGECSNEQAKKRKSGFSLSKLLHFFGGGIYAPDASTCEPIEILLNEENNEERDRLTEKWKESKLKELNFVGVVAALLAGVLTSTGSWPDILPNDEKSPWPVRTSWYCGIILSLFSILSTADQTVRLYRLSSHRDGYKNIRKLLSSNGRKSGRVQLNKAQIYTWQMPIMFLTTATICMIIGMFLHVWSATRLLAHEHKWNDDSKVAVTFSIVALFSISLFFAGQVTLYNPPEEVE